MYLCQCTVVLQLFYHILWVAELASVLVRLPNAHTYAAMRICRSVLSLLECGPWKFLNVVFGTNWEYYYIMSFSYSVCAGCILTVSLRRCTISLKLAELNMNTWVQCFFAVWWNLASWWFYLPTVLILCCLFSRWPSSGRTWNVRKLTKCHESVGENLVRENCSLPSSHLELQQCLVVSHMHVYYTFKYDVGNQDMARSGSMSQRNVMEFHGAWKGSPCSLLLPWCLWVFCHLGGGGGFGSGYSGSYGGGAMKSAGYSQRGAGPYGGLLWIVYAKIWMSSKAVIIVAFILFLLFHTVISLSAA